MASTLSNDENMLVYRGEHARRLCQIFLAEFMRVHTHFAAREAANERAATSRREAASGHDDGAEKASVSKPVEAWWRPFFDDGSKQQSERLLFATGGQTERAAGGVPPTSRERVDCLLKVKLLNELATLPVRGSALAAGYDLFAAAECVVPSRGRALVSTGLSIAVPVGCRGHIAPRAGFAWENRIDTGACMIGCDFRGEVMVLLLNHEADEVIVKPGNCVAQLIVEKIVTPDVVAVDDLDMSES